MNKRIRIVLAILFAAGASLYFGVFHKPGQSGPLQVSGNIEITEAQLGFKISGRLLERVVDEGQAVESGQLIGRLEAVDQELAVAQAQAKLAQSQAYLAELVAGSRKEEIAGAWAQLEQARFTLAELENGTRPQEIAGAQADLEAAMAVSEKARAQLHLAKEDFDRYSGMYAKGAATEREYQTYSTQYESAQRAFAEASARINSLNEKLKLLQEGPRLEQLDRARAALQQSQAHYDLVTAGPRVETIDQARAQLESASQALRQAQQQLAYTELLAPFQGVVISKSAEPGEYLNPGSPVVTIGDLDHVWLRAYVSETQLGKIKLGQTFQVATDSFPGKVYQGRLSFISSQAEFTPKTVQTFQERVKLMYRIKIDLENSSRELKPGMPANAAPLREG